MAKVLRNEASFTPLTPGPVLEEQLLVVERAGRTCYQSEKGPITRESAGKFVQMLLARGHESVLEHTLLTVKFTGVSRGFTHELVRHRLAGFSQESTRYVDYTREDRPDLNRFEMKVICPPHRDPNEHHHVPDVLVTIEDDGEFPAFNCAEHTFAEMAQMVEAFYRALRKGGWTPEDARQILPTGLSSDIVCSTNWREWRHIFQVRCARPAHWEIRSVMGDLLLWLQDRLPEVFGDFEIAGEDKNGVKYWRLR